jgi:hypothetical protein
MPDEDTIGRIIQRDLDQLPMLPSDRWVPREPATGGLVSSGRPAAFATAKALPLALAVVLVASAVGLGLANWRAQRTEPASSPGAAIGVPGPLALAGGAPSLGFGLVSTSANTLLVRNETTESAPFVFDNAPPPVAVSPNGHEIAYWQSVPNRTGGAMWELFRSDLIDASARNIGVMSAPAGEDPGPFVWSSDGTGLVVNTGTAGRRGAGQNAPLSSWFTVDVASRKVTRLPAGLERVVRTVHAWDRQRDLITGSGFDGARNTFTTLQGGRVATHSVAVGSTIGAADGYGRSVVIAGAGDCKGVATTARCPVLETRDQASFAVMTASAVGEPTASLPEVVFRARSQDLIVQLALPNGDARVELWSDLGRGPHRVLGSYSQTVRFTGPRELVLPRVDGSAVFLMKFDDSAGGRWFGEIVSLSAQGGQSPQRTPFEVRVGGNPIASVVLDPAFARAMEPARSAASPPPSVPIVGAPPVGDAAARAMCDGKLGSARLVGAFSSTAGVVADWVENVGVPDAPRAQGTAWRSLPANAPAYVCYFAGQFTISRPPPVPPATEPPLPDQAVILLDSTGTVLMPSRYGPSQNNPVVPPGLSRF